MSTLRDVRFACPASTSSYTVLEDGEHEGEMRKEGKRGRGEARGREK